MNKFGLLMFLASFLLTATVQVALADESMGEKVQAVGNDAKRGMKKAGNRIQEATCTKGDIKCAADKAGNRVEEATDGGVDGVKKAKNKID